MRTAMIAMLTLTSSTALANNLSGEWRLPSGGKATIAQKTDGNAQVVARLKVDKKPVKLVLEGKVAYVRVGDEGGLGITATAGSLPIRHEGKRCVVKDPKVSVLGDLVGQDDAKEYRARGSLHGHIFCGGKNTWREFVLDLTGTWK